jgi:hypothetical protein
MLSGVVADDARRARCQHVRLGAGLEAQVIAPDRVVQYAVSTDILRMPGAKVVRIAHWALSGNPIV